MGSAEGAMRAAFHSLSLNISFRKNKLVELIIEKLNFQSQFNSFIKQVIAFNNLNLDINFSSS